MSLTIRKAVKAFGGGRVDDVAVIQLYLADLGYFKRPINGNFDHQTKLAMFEFFAKEIDTPKKKTPRKDVLFAPGTPALAALTLGFLNSNLKKAQIFADTPIIYQVGAAGKKSESGADYRIPSELYGPLQKKLETLPFSFAYHDVRYQDVHNKQAKSFDEKFRIKIIFPNAQFVNPRTAKLTKIIPGTFREKIKRLLSGIPWSIETSPANSAYISLITKKGLGLYETLKRMDAYSGVRRVFTDFDAPLRGYKIPNKQSILKVIGAIHAVRCARTGADGGAAIPKESAESKRIVDEIMKNAPSGFKARIQSTCESCGTLGSDLKRIQLENNKLVETIGLEAGGFNKTKAETIVKEFDQTARGFLKNTLNSVGNRIPGNPLELGTILTDPKLKTRNSVDDKFGFCEILVGSPRISDLFPSVKFSDNIAADKSFLAKSAGSIAESAVQQKIAKGLVRDKTLNQISRSAGGLKALGKIFELEDLMNTLLSGCELIVNTPEYVQDLEEIEQAYKKLTLALYNIWALLEANEILYTAKLRDFKARKCGEVWWGHDQFIAGEAVRRHEEFITRQGVKDL